MNETLAKLEKWGCDVKGSMERMVDDEDLLLTCIKMVPDDESFTALGKALESGTAEEAFDCAHTIKGITANTGVIPLYEIVVDIVEPLRKGNKEGLMPIYEKLMKKCNELKELLK